MCKEINICIKQQVIRIDRYFAQCLIVKIQRIKTSSVLLSVR